MTNNLKVLEYDYCEKLRRKDDGHDELVRRIPERIMRCIFVQICIIETNGWRRINRTVLFRLYLIHFSSQRRDLSLKRFPIQFSTKLYKRGYY
jgi:hypothetical protein